MGEESRGDKSRSRVPCVIKSREMDPKLGQEGGLPEIAHFPIFYSDCLIYGESMKTSLRTTHKFTQKTTVQAKSPVANSISNTL